MHLYKVDPMCRLLGISRQGYYKHTEKTNEEDILISSIVWYCQYIRAPDNLPRSGCRELWELNQQYFKDKLTFGRDKFYDVLRANGLMLKKKKYRPKTTDSNHLNKIYPDLLNTSPKFAAKAPGQLIVCDITYVYCLEGFGFLSLITDAYSRYIVGYCFYESLDTEGPLAALEMAFECYDSFGISIGKNTIHHTDRGVQYTSAAYIKVLKEMQIQISMTQTGDPLHNAMSERVNGTIKNSWMVNNGDLSFTDAGTSIGKAIMMYNKARPHQGIDMKTPYEMMCGMSDNPLLYQKNEYGT